MTDIIDRLRNHVTYGYVPSAVRACMDDAAKEIERLRAQIPDDGFVIVPAEPTEAMRRAAGAAMSPGHRPTQKWVGCAEKHAIRYRAMIAAYQSGIHD